MAKIIYICGMGHNGSTVLDLILDRADGVHSVGQLNNLLVPADPTADADPRRAKYWQTVLSKLNDDERALMIRMNKGVLKEKAFVRHWLIPSKRRAYAAVNQKVADAVFAEVQGECIVDSSKNIARILGLLSLRDHQVVVIHLIRDVRGFVNSHNMRRQESGRRNQYFLPTLMWFIKNLLASVIVRPMATNFMTLRYEDILANPESTFATLEAFVGEDLEESKRAVLGEVPVDASRSLGFSGNRILHSRKKIYFDRSRSARNGVYDSRIYWYAYGWISRFWGYRSTTVSNSASPPTDKSN